MAVVQLSMSADQYACSVCLEVMKEPVTIPCGHSYCMGCINDFWDQSDKEGVYNCPQCRKAFNVRPELNRNTVLTDLLEKVKDVRVDVSLSESYAGPDDVCCDVCPVKKLKAVKTCMTCLVSYCDIHLQPHRESGAYKRHKLEEPTENLEEKLCAKHQKVLEIFCRTDGTCVCLLCVATEHKSHDTVTPEEERAGRESQLEETQTELENQIEEKEEKLEEIKETIERIQSSAETEVQEYEETFKSVLEYIEKLRSEVIDVIREYERREVRKAEELIEQLEKEIKELKWRDAELDELSQTNDHIHFLKKFPSFCHPPTEGDAPELTVDKDFLPEALRMNLSDLKMSLEETRDWEFVKTSEEGVEDSSFILQNVRFRNRLLQYSCPLTLDPNTAQTCLQLLDENRKVTCDETETPYPDHPERFDYYGQVLCREALSGTRCYWEVEWTGDEFDIGVTYKGIERKGEGDECRLGCNDKSWSLYINDSSFSVWHNNICTDISTPSSHRIGVYLDYAAGSLSFYSVSDIVTLLYRFNTSFTEPLYPAFWVGENCSLTICTLSSSDQ
uniref:Tripartite motif-containing protein 16-like n=1 Tax=Erpetoichthys calabaricus TaxID=27687 RepID=A0A8C4TJ14_ERPCA